MDFKIRFFNSEHLNEVDTRRLKIKHSEFTLNDFISFLKKLNDLESSEDIFVFWKDTWEWPSLTIEDDWQQFIDRYKEEPNELLNVNVYYGNVHIDVKCNLCGKVVIGNRHKCLQCINFDICQLCYEAKVNCHKEHCLLLLRTPADSRNCLQGFSLQSSKGGPEYRVTDVDLENMAIEFDTGTGGAQKIEGIVINGDITDIHISSTDEKKVAMNGGVYNNTEISSTEEKCVGTDMKINECHDHTNGSGSESCREYKSPELESVVAELKTLSDDDASIPREIMENLAPNIREGLNVLKSMGFKNITAQLIVLLIENKGDVVNVIEDIEYSLKKK